jgi:IclR family acetate operon transcriptional repressor
MELCSARECYSFAVVTQSISKRLLPAAQAIGTSIMLDYVDRCLSLIEALAEAPCNLSLGALAQQLDLPKSATHRLLQSLAGRGYVQQDPASQDYALSLKVALLAFRYLDARRLPDVAQDALDRLAQASGEYCRMALVEGEGLVWVARAQGATQGLRYDPPMGRDVVLHATATGKAWLATLPEQEALRIACARGFATPPGFGARAVKDVDELRHHLAATRARGYASAVEEGEPGTVALAATFRAYDGAGAPVAGTVSIAGPLVRLTETRVTELAPLLQDATARISALWPLRQRQVAPPRAAPERAEDRQLAGSVP